MKQPKFIYISDPLFQTVKDSQVLNWLEVLGKRNIDFDLILITRISYLLKNNNLRKEKVSKAKKTIFGKVKQVYIIRNNDKTMISTFLILLYLLITLFSSRFISKRKVIIQTRMGNISTVLFTLTRFYSNIKIVFDYRGAGAEEYINGLGYKSIEEVKDTKIVNNYNKQIDSQMTMIDKSNYVFCVSKKLKEYALCLFDNAIDDNKFVVVPGSADENQFFYDVELRIKTRKELNLSNRKIITYTGKLDSHWHNKEEIFKLAKGLINLDNNFYFLCVTPELTMANELASKFNISNENFIAKFVQYEEIPAILNASDFGVILRDNIKTNHVASPTKVPEYLLCGLPVIMSENIGDYSSFVKNHKLGIVIKDSTDNNVTYNDIQNLSINRSHIALIGKKYYAKQRVVDKILEVYKEISI
jgi:hypothetical protein